MNVVIKPRIRTSLIFLLAVGTPIMAQTISPPITFVQASNVVCKVGRASVKPGETVTWQGQCASGFAQGSGAAQGLLDDKPTLRFEGTFVRGVLDGKGNMIGADGDRFEGQYKEGLRHGFGVYVSANGTRFEGEYRNNQRVDASVSAAEAVQQQLAQAPSSRTSPPNAPQPDARRGAPPSTAQEQLAQQKLADEQRHQRLAQQVAYERRRQQELLLLWALLASPLVGGALVAATKSNGAVLASNKLDEWINVHDTKAREKTDFFTEFVSRPVLWCFHKLSKLTAPIDSPFVKSGVRLASWLYLVGAILLLAYLATAIAIIVAVLWVINEVYGSYAPGSVSGASPKTSSSKSYVDDSGKSIVCEEFVGKYVEHRDVKENVISKAQDREDFRHQYVQHRDADGKVVGESTQHEDFVEKYVEHRDADGKVVGESRRREDFVGPSTENKKIE
jgi:hypothetical protein